jgi:hypothetical protein
MTLNDAQRPTSDEAIEKHQADQHQTDQHQADQLAAFADLVLSHSPDRPIEEFMTLVDSVEDAERPLRMTVWQLGQTVERRQPSAAFAKRLRIQLAAEWPAPPKVNWFTSWLAKLEQTARALTRPRPVRMRLALAVSVMLILLILTLPFAAPYGSSLPGAAGGAPNVPGINNLPLPLITAVALLLIGGIVWWLANRNQ